MHALGSSSSLSCAIFEKAHSQSYFYHHHHVYSHETHWRIVLKNVHWHCPIFILHLHDVNAQIRTYEKEKVTHRVPLNVMRVHVPDSNLQRFDHRVLSKKY
jgi:hypothetical protein